MPPSTSTVILYVVFGLMLATLGPGITIAIAMVALLVIGRLMEDDES